MASTPDSAPARPSDPAAPLRIVHPSGTILVAAEIRPDLTVPHATVFRTARRLFQGEVLWQPPTG